MQSAHSAVPARRERPCKQTHRIPLPSTETSASGTLCRRRSRRRPHGARPGHHGGRERSARRWRTGGARCSTGVLPHSGQIAARRHHRRAGRRQEHVHRRARHAPDSRLRRKRRGAERRSVQPDLRRQHSRRQDAHGAAGGRGAARSSDHRHRADIWAALRGARARPFCCARQPGIATSWWKPSASGSRRPPSGR